MTRINLYSNDHFSIDGKLIPKVYGVELMCNKLILQNKYDSSDTIMGIDIENVIVEGLTLNNYSNKEEFLNSIREITFKKGGGDGEGGSCNVSEIVQGLINEGAFVNNTVTFTVIETEIFDKNNSDYNGWFASNHGKTGFKVIAGNLYNRNIKALTFYNKTNTGVMIQDHEQTTVNQTTNGQRFRQFLATGESVTFDFTPETTFEEMKGNAFYFNFSEAYNYASGIVEVTAVYTNADGYEDGGVIGDSNI